MTPRLVAATIFLLVWQSGLATLAPGYPHGDSGETAGVALFLGIAHPPGYPLPTLLGHLCVQWLAVGTVAWRVSLLSLGSAATAAALIPGILRPSCPGLPSWWSLLLGVAGGLSLEVWNQMTLPKGSVYTVTVALLAVVAWSLARVEGLRPRMLGLASLAVGLASSAHYPLVLPSLLFVPLWLAPSLVSGARDWMRTIRGPRDVLPLWTSSRLRTVVLASCFGLVGVSVYLYLPLRTPTAHPAFRWAEPVTWKRLQWLVFRQQYMSIEKQERGGGGWLLVRRFGGRWVEGRGLVGALLLVAGCAVAVRRREGWLLALAGGGVAEVALAAFYPKLEADALWVADPFFTAGWFLLSLPVVRALSAMAEAPWPRARSFAAVLALWLVGLAFHAGFERASKRWNYYASDLMANLAATLPANALVFTEGDGYIAPMLYGLNVDGLRSDVRMIIPIFLHFDWGLGLLHAQYPDLRLKSMKPWGHIWLEAKDLMEEHPERPWVYSLTTSSGWPFERFAVPEGLVYRIVGAGKAVLDPAVDRRTLRYRLRDTLTARMARDPFGRVVRDNYIEAYFRRGIQWHVRKQVPLAVLLFTRARRLGSPEAALNLGLAFYESGDLPRAARNWRESLVLAPGRPEPYVNLALIALRQVPPQPDEAISLCEKALTVDRKFVKAYEVLSNAWYLKGDLPQALNRLNEALTLRPGDPNLARMRSMLLQRGGGRR